MAIFTSDLYGKRGLFVALVFFFEFVQGAAGGEIFHGDDPFFLYIQACMLLSGRPLLTVFFDKVFKSFPDNGSNTVTFFMTFHVVN